MGTYSNGVYVPAIDETGWGALVNDGLTQIGRERVNVCEAPYGLKGDGTTESAGALSAIQAVSATKTVVFPAGNFKFPDGVGLQMTGSTSYVGAGRRATVITTKDAYAFISPATGAMDEVYIRDIGTQLRTGATSGGGIKAVSNSYHSSWGIERVECSGINIGTGPTTPLVWLDGYIGGYLNHVRVANAGGDGFKVASAGFVSNIFAFYHCGVSNITGQAYNFDGGSAGQINGGTVEGSAGIAIANGHVSARIRGVWFEGNQGIHINCTGASTNTVITENKFHNTTGANHVRFQNTAHYGVIHSNTFQDAPGSGDWVLIDSGVTGTNIGPGNKGLDRDQHVTDNGTGTAFWGPDRDGWLPINANLWLSPTGYLLMKEQTDPGAPVTNKVALYAKDNGSGKTQIVARFPTGAVQVIATEP